MFTRKLQLPQHGMPTAEEFALWGARELTYEELLAVNGGRHVIDDPRTDDISDTIADGGHSPRGSESTGNNGSSGGSSGGSGGSSGGGSSAPPSSSPSEPVTGSDSDDTGGGYTDYWEGACTGWYESGGSSGGGSSNGSSGSSDNHSSDSGNADSGSSDDSWGGSSGNDSSDSGGSYTGGSYTGGGYTYTPPVQNQPVPKPPAGNNVAPAQQEQGNDLPQAASPTVVSVPREKTRLRVFFDKTKNAISDTVEDLHKKIDEAQDKARQTAEHVWKEATKWHYEDREAKNKNLPSYDELEKIKKEGSTDWIRVPKDLSKYHQNGTGSSELKFTNKDGREAVYTKDFSSDGSYELYTDPLYKGTYNYVTPSILPGAPDSITDFEGIGNFVTDGSKFLVTGTGHFFCDMLPYYALGNER